MVAYLFAGQGAQYIGMGKDLYESFPESKAVFDKADKVLGFSISKLCFEGPQEELTKTKNCQPAIVAASIAALEAYKAQGTSDKAQVKFVAGLSLGEYSALVAAGAISFEDAIYLVRRRGEYMEEEALKNPGKMASLIGLDLSKVKEVCAKTNTEIANINCPGQIVISGSPSGIEEAVKLAKEIGARMAIILDVSGAFHSSFMKGATLKLAKELDSVKINAPRIPVISNVSGKPVASAFEIEENLIKQVASSVLWEDSMKFILNSGVSKFIEFGPGKVLKGLMRRIDVNAEVKTVEKKADIIV
ncbi:MAG: ACP S-malonyltransferase [Candidatus Omnitrophica bacterium]|nr:ACP S-malonyltransferase [Candidatus Omnitrophota bacterium]